MQIIFKRAFSCISKRQKRKKSWQRDSSFKDMQIILIDICRGDNGNRRGINGKKNSWHSSLLEQKKEEVEQAHALRPKALPAIFSSDIWVMSALNLICLSQIWVKKETKKARIYDISHFATKLHKCSEPNLIFLSQI